MKETGKRKLRKIYNVLFAVFTLAVGLVFISQVWGIFRSAPEKAFSRESVGERLMAISPVWIVWILGLIAGEIINALTPKPIPLPLKGGKTSAQNLRSFAKRFKKGGKEVAGVSKLRALRLAVRLVGGAVILFALGFGISYLFNENYVAKHTAHIFTSHRAVADRLVMSMPFFALALLVGFLISITCEHLRVKEVDIFIAVFIEEKQKVKRGENSTLLYEKGVDSEYLTLLEKWRIWLASNPEACKIGLLSVRIGLFVAAVVLIILGINWGGMDLVFEKARSICQQCIGLG